MPFEVYWKDDTQTIIEIDVIGQIKEWKENNDAFAKAWTMIRMVSHPVYVIVYADSKAKMPKGSPIPHLTHNLAVAPDNVALLISVVASLFERVIIDIVKTANKSKRFYNKMTGVPSMESALEMITKDKAKLQANKP